jgi:6-phosphogluconolactonase
MGQFLALGDAVMTATLISFSERSACVRQLAEDLGHQLREVLARKPRAGLLLPGGSSPQALLPLLRRQALDWSRVDLSPTDERWVEAEDPASNWRLLSHGLPEVACLDPRQAEDPQSAAEHWGRNLEGWQPFAAVLLGMGEDGHIASLFPGMPGLAAALDLGMPPRALLGWAPEAPRQRLSLSLSLLCDCDWLGLLAFGAVKRRLLEQALADQPDSRGLPLHALLHQEARPVRLYWAP